MAIKTYKPTTNARRHMTSPSFEEITKTTPEKSLLEPLKKKAEETIQVKLLFVIEAAVLNVSIELLTSNVIKMIFLEESHLLNMIES